MDFLADIASEHAVLAGLIQFGQEAFIDVDGIVSEDTFTLDCNAVLFKCIKHHFQHSSNSLDYPSIFAAAKEVNVLTLIDNVDDKKYIKSLQNFAVKKENIRKLAIKIRKLQIARLLHDELAECQHEVANVRGTETVGQIIGLAESKLFDFSNKVIDGNNNDTVLLGNGIREYVEHIKTDPKEMLGISTGFPTYDIAIGGGLRRKSVNLISARPKVGKTTFAINVALYVANSLNIPVLMLDTEMAQNDHWHKSLAYFSEVTVRDIETGKFTLNNLKLRKIDDAISKIEQIPYYYKNISGMDFEEILSIARRWIMKYVGFNTNGTTKDCLIIYDYLKLMSGDGLKDMQEYQLLGFQMTNLHNFTIKYDVPCLSFVQLNRDGITKETTDVVSQSDRIMWFCSNFSIFKHKSEEEIAEDGIENGNRKLLPLICRHGEGLQDGDYINMALNGGLATIKEISTRYKARSDKQKTFEGNEDVAY